jgi:hypothetical protein
MKLVDSAIRYAIPHFGVGVRWLKEELHARGVSVRLTQACLRELVMDADAAARLQVAGPDAPKPYVPCLRQQIAARAEFLRTWTLSDDRVDLDGAVSDHLVRIARRYALPRPWKLSEPVASECRHPTPTYLYWARAS